MSAGQQRPCCPARGRAKVRSNRCHARRAWLGDTNAFGKGAVGKQKSIKLTRFELEIMEELWRLGQASIREVQEALPEKRRPAYTTVQTIVHRLEAKGVVRRAKKIGNAFVFEAVVTRAAAHRRLITELLEMLGGSARPLLAHLVEMGELSLEDLKDLEQIAQQAQEGPGGPSNEAAIPSRGRRQK